MFNSNPPPSLNHAGVHPLSQAGGNYKSIQGQSLLAQGKKIKKQPGWCSRHLQPCSKILFFKLTNLSSPGFLSPSYRHLGSSKLPCNKCSEIYARIERSAVKFDSRIPQVPSQRAAGGGVAAHQGTSLQIRSPPQREKACGEPPSSGTSLELRGTVRKVGKG